MIFIGDASMSPYELTHAGGSVEHINDEAGLTWLHRVQQTWPSSVWLNPSPEQYWGFTQSIKMVSQSFEGRMFPLTLEGIDAAMRQLTR